MSFPTDNWKVWLVYKKNVENKIREWERKGYEVPNSRKKKMLLRAYGNAMMQR